MTISIRPSRPSDFQRTFDIWRSAVVATHDFLSAEDFAAIEEMVATHYLPQAELWIAADADDVALGFMGMSSFPPVGFPAHVRHLAQRRRRDA
ncbi:hypothetical protein J2Z19_004925 [Ensifer adhaerens]|uniref:Uncharacterized protein n=1 Tax=Ensifer adhaerens TaxID=106592 RepID=A0ACC5T250_ENSAD|nr:hypothetical protein [Ensifer adhaerens]MBP1875192.1 hypothetical protein [Ensifer adhaerens]